ncbi:MAG: hypothetical protein P8H69_09605 [Planktomarina sp.]|nr:hypothetical protein [Planktomarina sp.]
MTVEGNYCLVITVIRGVAETLQFGLSTVIRRALHEGPLSGNEPNFAKVAICAKLPLMLYAANVRIPPIFTPIAGNNCFDLNMVRM